MPDAPRYCYLGGDALHSGMYVALIRRLEAEGLTVDLASRIRISLNPLASWAAWRHRDRIGPNSAAAIRSSIRGEVHMLPVWAPFPELSAPSLERAVGGCRPGRAVVLHTRQVAMGRLALALKRRCSSVRVIVELEGDAVAEAQYKHARNGRPTWRDRRMLEVERRFYTRTEGQLVRRSDAVVCVSHKLKDRMIARYGLGPADAERMHVFPSVASRERFSFDPARRARRRHALGLEDRLIVLYNGNLIGPWQVPRELVQVFVRIREVRPDAFFLVLTPEDHGRMIRPHLEAARLPGDSFRLTACPHEEVVDYLCAADVGLLLRERDPMNEVAAPGKFAEYVLSGLPTILTDGIGDFSEAAKQSECACVLPDLADLDASRPLVRAFVTRTFTDAERAAFARWGADRFAIELYLPRLAALYRSLAGERPAGA